MKIFGFKTNNEKVFIHIVCNVIIVLTICCIFAVSLFSPTVSVSYLKNNLAIYSGNKEKKDITLMVNVYWGTEYLEEMLVLFKQENIKTTFFVGGCWVAKNNDILGQIASYGHEIGNHGYYHKDHAKLTSEQNQDEIYITHELVKSVINYDMNLFAPPSGSYNNTTLDTANKLGYKTIMWTRDTIDWRDKDAKLIYERATKNPANGDLILMHPTKSTVEALPKIIRELKGKGFNLTTVSNNLS